MANDRIPSQQQQQEVLDASCRALNESVSGRTDIENRLQAAARQVLDMQPKQQAAQPVWPWVGGLMAAGIAAVVLMQQPTTMPAVPDSAQDVVFSMAELDDTEWDLVQDFDFALWLSQLDPDELENLPAI